MKFLVKIMLLIYMCMQTAFAAQVVLDAGHGGKDPGAVRSLNGKQYKEKDIVLDVTRHIQRELTSQGYDVAMTRTSDTFHALDRRRAQSILQCEKLFMSIHADAHKDTKAKGGTVLVYPNASKESHRAANIARSAISSKRVARSQAVRVLRNGNPKCASILVEIGFMSNEGDLAQLADPTYRRTMGKKLANAAAKYVGSSKKPVAKKSTQSAKATEKTVKVNAKAANTQLTPSRQSVSKKTVQKTASLTPVRLKKEVSKKETVKKETAKKDIVKKEVVKSANKSDKKSVKTVKNNGQAV